ncbi:hypothetical protein [Euryhalocaulis caribicus]|uniref:hypothetical protein n=1 Tax=Euryhalocaulis caribicus TaxID=1161401 RepID=UPI0003A1CFE6|nr:hypothetical protein [Euryhalocaulis caribicus]
MTEAKSKPDKKPAGKKPAAKKPAGKSPETGIHPVSRYFLFLDDPKVRTLISFGVIAVAVILLVADFFVSRHAYDYVAFSETNGFYAIYGFIGFAFVVLMGWPLRALLGRSEDYYGEPDDDA